MKAYARSFVLGVLLLSLGVGTSWAQKTTWDFQSDTLGQVLPHIGWTQSDINPVVTDDPLNPGQGNHVLENIVHNYNAAAVLMAILPSGKTLADYSSFNFKGYFQKGDVGYKNIIVQAYSSMPTGHAFASPNPDSIGAYNRSKGAGTTWEDISVPINGSSSMTDTVYLAFGFNCAGTANSDTTTWFADSIQLVPKPVVTPVTMWTFQSDSLGDSLAHMGWTQADIHPVVAPDPVNPTSGHRVLENIVHNYGAATVLMAILPSGKTMADYGSFDFKGYFKQGDIAYKYIILQAFSSMPTGNAFKDTLGYYDRAKGASTAWENISIPFTGSATMSDTVYLAFGINCAGTANNDTTEWFADSLQLVPKSVAPPAPAAPVLATPASGATGVPRRATLTWNSSSGAANYHLQVAADNSFGTIVFDTTTAGESVQLSTALSSNTTYYWRVSAVNAEDSASEYSTSSFTTGVGILGVGEMAGLPKVFALFPAYPNPFNPSTIIQYDLPKVSDVTIRVYDAIGREIATLINGREAAGSYKVTFNMDRYASGVYFVRMVAGSYIHVEKLMLLK